MKTKVAVAMVAIGVAIGAGLPPAHTQTQFTRAKDPGVRGGRLGAGGPLANLSPEESEMFTVGLEDFSEEEEVAEGVGPRFNFVGCAGCHSQPAVGGTSPKVNPLFRVTGDLGFSGNRDALVHHSDGPIREARFSSSPTAPGTVASTRSS